MIFKKIVYDYAKKVDNKLKETLAGKSLEADGINRFLSECYKYNDEFVLRGGKRLRPVTCIKAFEAVKGNFDEKILLPAAAIELFHASSLAHDDIMDEDELRRNKPSMHSLFREYFNKSFKDKQYKGSIFTSDSKRFSTSLAIIQGNILFSLGQECISNSKFEAAKIAEAFNLIQRTYREVNEGQVLDLLFEWKDITEAEYLFVAKNKTARLFGASFELGAIFAGASQEQRDILNDFAENIAIAFQIQDDIMDISKNMKKGNTFGSDIRKGKKTLMLIHCLKNCTEGQKEKILCVFGNPFSDKNSIKEVVDIFEQNNSIEYAKNTSQDYITKAKEKLSANRSLFNEDSLSFFEELAEFMVNRDI